MGLAAIAEIARRVVLSWRRYLAFFTAVRIPEQSNVNFLFVDHPPHNYGICIRNMKDHVCLHIRICEVMVKVLMHALLIP